jgi:hypothetical protein
MLLKDLRFSYYYVTFNQVWWYMPVIPIPRRPAWATQQDPASRKRKISQVLVAHTYNPSFSRGSIRRIEV